jgi:uncharacterized glyoxalase superfamily protein PhnB
MSNPVAPSVDCSSVTPGFIVKDINDAISFYRDKLGFKLEFMWGDPVHFAGMSIGKIHIHLMQGEVTTGKSLAYFAVEGIDELYEFHVANGVEITEPIGNRDYDMRDYQTRDPYGNLLGFGHYIFSKNPPLKIERVDVALRLEKRLAALLKDLAEHKGMSIDSAIEETLLHTFEPWGDGVASPHTMRDLKYIQELKKKHGIDYDVHASYRFVE